MKNLIIFNLLIFQINLSNLTKEIKLNIPLSAVNEFGNKIAMGGLEYLDFNEQALLKVDLNREW